MLQLVEVAERTRLIGELQAEGIALALPLDAGSIDLLAWIDAPAGSCQGGWVPISLAAMAAETDEISRGIAAAHAPGAFIAVIYDDKVGCAATRTFAFTPAELVMVKMVEVIQRNRGTDGNKRAQSIMTAMREVVEPFAIATGQWRQKLVAVLEERAGGTR